MQRSGSQKALLVFSILEIIGAVICLMLGIMSIVATGAISGAEVSQGVQGLTAEETKQAAGILFAMGSIVLIVMGIWSLLCGIFGIRAANDNQKIMIVWVFLLIGLILGILGFVASIVNGQFGNQMWSLIFSLAFSVIMFWIANNIKREAGK